MLNLMKQLPNNSEHITLLLQSLVKLVEKTDDYQQALWVLDD